MHYLNVVMLACCLNVLVESHPGGTGNHNELDTIMTLKRNIHAIQNLLVRQERRLAVGFGQLHRRIVSLDNTAKKAERQIKGRAGSCLMPSAPTNGRILGASSGTSGGTAQELYFVCDEGFHLKGSETRICLKNGSWSGTDVTCIDKRVELGACAALNCQNGGICTPIGANRKYRCQCPPGFTGKRCARDLPGFHSSVRTARCTGTGENKVCQCDKGFKLGARQILCLDIDECSTPQQATTDVIPDDVAADFISKRHANNKRLCRHLCVNTPGSYRCVCPAGYEVGGTENEDCFDIDECDLGTHNCSAGQQCFNTGGGFQCVAVNCPENYTKISPFVCRRNACSSGRKCRNEPLTISFAYLNLPRGMKYPADVFRLTADESSSANFNRFVVPSGNGAHLFGARKLGAIAGVLVLKRPLDDVQSTTVDFEWRELTPGKSRRLVAKYLTRIVVFTSRHNY